MEVFCPDHDLFRKGIWTFFCRVKMLGEGGSGCLYGAVGRTLCRSLFGEIAHDLCHPVRASIFAVGSCEAEGYVVGETVVEGFCGDYGSYRVVSSYHQRPAYLSCLVTGPVGSDRRYVNGDAVFGRGYTGRCLEESGCELAPWEGS